MKFYAKVRLIENYVIVKTGFLLIRNQFCFEMPCLCIYYIGGGSQNGGFEFKKFAACSNWGISSQLAIKVVAYEILFFFNMLYCNLHFFTFNLVHTINKRFTTHKRFFYYPLLAKECFIVY